MTKNPTKTFIGGIAIGMAAGSFITLMAVAAYAHCVLIPALLG